MAADSINDNYLVRSETLTGFDEFVRELGGEPEAFYRRVELTSSLFDNPDYMVPYARVCRLMEMAAVELQREDFGLEIASRIRRFQIGVLWPLAANSPDVGAAIQQVIEYYHLHSQGLSWALTVSAGNAFVEREDRIAGSIPTFQYASHSVASCFKLLRTICGEDWRPREVRFIHSPPENRQAFNRFFGLKVKFNQERSGLVFPSSYLERSLTENREWLHSQISKQLLLMEEQNESEQEFCGKVKKLIHSRMHSASCTQAEIADQLGMHSKKLQRELRKHGVTFRQLRADVRLDMAERYLSDSEIPLTIVAAILGFSELSSFSHTFKLRNGMSPADWRRMAVSAKPRP